MATDARILGHMIHAETCDAPTVLWFFSVLESYEFGQRQEIIFSKGPDTTTAFLTCDQPRDLHTRARLSPSSAVQGIMRKDSSSQTWTSILKFEE